MNVLIGKVGRPIFFNPARWGHYAGDEEGMLLYTLLAERYPQHTFYLAGRSDLDDEATRQVTPPNIVDLTADVPKNLWCGTTFYDGKTLIPPKVKKAIESFTSNNQADWRGKLIESAFDDSPIQQKIKGMLLRDIERVPNATFHVGAKTIWYDSQAHFWLEAEVKKRGLKFDLGIFFLGPSSCSSIPGVGVKNLDGTNSNTTMMLQNYGGPILHLMNVTGVPNFFFCADPRYVPWRARDVFNDEKFILSQVNETLPIKRIKSYAEADKIRTHHLKYEYSGIETVFMLNERKVDWRNIAKDIKFTVFLNGKGSFSADREKIIETWVLKNHKEAKVYGIWNDGFAAKYPDQIENVALKNLNDVAFRTRYTLVPPFTNAKSSFVTQKFFKMLYYGIIPFFHPKYDTSKIFKVPAELRPYGPMEMWERMTYLDEHPEERAALLEKLYALLDDGYFNGDFLTGVVNRAAERCIGRTL